MLQPILLVIIPRLQARIRSNQVFICSHAPGVVCNDGGAFEALAQDFVAGAQAGRVEGGGENGALFLEEIEEAGAGDGHCGGRRGRDETRGGRYGGWRVMRMLSALRNLMMRWPDLPHILCVDIS